MTSCISFVFEATWCAFKNIAIFLDYPFTWRASFYFRCELLASRTLHKAITAAARRFGSSRVCVTKYKMTTYTCIECVCWYFDCLFSVTSVDQYSTPSNSLSLYPSISLGLHSSIHSCIMHYVLTACHFPIPGNPKTITKMLPRDLTKTID